MNRLAKMMITAAVASLILAGCANNGRQDGEKPQNEAAAGANETNSEADAAPAPFEPVTVIDASGQSITLDKPAEKVACVVSLCVDTLIELGMEPIAIAESGVRTIAASPEFYGSAGESIPSIGGSFFEPNLEDLVTADPDLVIGLQGVHDTLREGLSGVAPIVLLNPKNYEESIAALEMIGQLTGKGAEAAEAKRIFLDKLANAKDKAPMDTKAVILFGTDVNFSVVTATGLGGSVLREIAEYPWHVEKPEDDPYGEGSVMYSLEKLLIENPDVIFVESYSFGPNAQPVSEQLAASPLWSELKAVQQNQVHEVRSPIWGDGRGTRSLGIMLDEAMAILYPELH